MAVHLLREAAHAGHSFILKRLLGQDSSHINCCDEDGRTLLHYASSEGHPATVALLLEMGCDPSLPALNGELARDVASNEQVATVFLRYAPPRFSHGDVAPPEDLGDVGDEPQSRGVTSEEEEGLPGDSAHPDSSIRFASSPNDDNAGTGDSLFFKSNPLAYIVSDGDGEMSPPPSSPSDGGTTSGGGSDTSLRSASSKFKRKKPKKSSGNRRGRRKHHTPTTSPRSNPSNAKSLLRSISQRFTKQTPLKSQSATAEYNYNGGSSRAVIPPCTCRIATKK